MTSHYTRSRYALWNHTSQFVHDPIEWRVTPKSKDVIALAAAVRLSGYARVLEAPHAHFIKVEITSKQAAEIKHWTSALPDAVMKTTAETDYVISHEDTYVCLDSSYRCTSKLPEKGQLVALRVIPTVARIGSLRKAQLRITDVFVPDIASE